MVSQDAGRMGFLEWAASYAAFEGETESGDAHVVEFSTDRATLAVIDGLGHGPEAAVASRTAAAVISEDAHAPLRELIRRSHDALRTTRGAAITVASIDRASDELRWTAVGNVEGRLLRAGSSSDLRNESVLQHGGVVGFQLPNLYPTSARLEPNDLVILATDGVRPAFGIDVRLSDPVQHIARRILEDFRKDDDALVLVARYLPRT